MLQNFKKSLALLLISCAFSCSSNESSSDTTEEVLNETDIEGIVTEIVDENINNEDQSEDTIDRIIERINEEEIIDDETIDEITKEVVQEINEEEVTTPEMVEEIVDKVVEEVMEEVMEENNEDEEVEVETPTENEEVETVTVSNSVVGTYGQLSIDGANVVNKNGEAVQLRGMSLFWSQWDDGAVFYNRETIKWLKEDWHATIVRAAMGIQEGDGLGFLNNPDTEKEKVFAVIDAAIEEGIYVIVDWHSHEAENQLEEAKRFFSEVAQKYGDYPNIIYETYNEPKLTSQNNAWISTLKPYHEEVVSTIREYDSDNIIVCGTRIYSQAVNEVINNEIDDENVAYTLHYYSSTHLSSGSVRNNAVQAINAGIPLFVTEFGVTEASGGGTINTQQAQDWWEFLDENKISWCNWSITNKNESSAALNSNTTINSLSVNNLTTSGQMVYDEMISKNEDFE